MKQEYKSINFKAETYKVIAVVNAIIEEYKISGDIMTVRQCYYQLVARGYIENTERSYKRITGIVNDGKMAGMIDWDAIEDRTRAFIRRGRWNSGKEILDGCARQFHMDLWKGQRTRVFCMVEKEALAGVLERVCHEYDVPLLAARGYPSGTVLREFVESDVLPYVDKQRIQILHLGDHDPSGLDMTRDLVERINCFAQEDRFDISLTRIALNMQQINEQKPPPNPAKQTDARFKEYEKEFGDESWELDALTPSFLRELVKTNIRKHIDISQWGDRKAQINSIKQRIKKVAEEFA